MYFFNFRLVVVFLVIVTATCKLQINITTLPSACNLLSNGWHYILPFNQETMQKLTSNKIQNAVPIYVYCYNGYTIINLNEDQNIGQYFSSTHAYLESASGPDLNDHVSWEQWWLPSLNIMLDNNNEMKPNKTISWSVTETDCTKCLSENDLEYGSQTAYYMTPDITSCNWPTKTLCDFDLDTLECYKCKAENVNGGEVITGKCGHVQFNVSQVSAENHGRCTEVIMCSDDAFLPSISTSNSYCVCYKPNDEYLTYYDVNTKYLEELQEKRENEKIQEDLDEENAKTNKITTNTVYLSKTDFEEGTYRIKESGTYILTENIVFNPHSLSEKDILEGISPNSEGAWMPYSEQYDEYPGADDNDGWYWMGFFSAITVESSNVVIDLGGYTIAMDPTFYYQQRYFIGIHISNKPFADTQGPTWSGVGQIRELSNIEIKNGTIGLSSHIGIRGIECHSIYLQDLIIRDFETHGVVFNAFTNLELNNVDIGPSVLSQLPVNGNYNLVRLSLPTFRKANEEIGDKTINFFNRSPVTYSDLYNKLITEMDLVFKYIAYNDQSVTTHEYWPEASNLFVSEIGISRAATIYGAVFRSEGAEVFNFGTFRGDSLSYNLTLNNVKIHDIEIATQEVVGIGKLTAREMLNAPIAFLPATNNYFENYEKATYVGNLLTDILVALHQLSNNWWFLNRMACDSRICDLWTLQGMPLNEQLAPMSCGWDTLGHIPKGAIGIKLEFTKGVKINNVEISNIHSLSDLGTDKCGEWTDSSNGGHMLQAGWSNKGYMATHAFGMVLHTIEGIMQNVNINNIVSYYGPAYGYYLMMNNNLTIQDNEIHHIFGGVMNTNDYSYDHLPNRANRACAIENNTNNYDSQNTNQLNLQNILQYCLSGHTGCNFNDNETDSEQYSSMTDDDHIVEPANCKSTTIHFSDGQNIYIDEKATIHFLEKEATFWKKTSAINEKIRNNNKGDINDMIQKLLQFKFNKILLSMTIPLIIILTFGIAIMFCYECFSKQHNLFKKNNNVFEIKTEKDPLL